MNSDGNLQNVTSMENATSMLSDAAVVKEDDSMLYGIPKSPGSFLGSSIRSNQVESFDIESESCSVNGENPGWRLGMPWFSNNHNRRSKKRNNKNQELHRYYGGIMKASGESSAGPASPLSTKSNSSRNFRPLGKNTRRSSHANNGNTKRNGKQTTFQKEKTAESTIHEKDTLSVPIARSKSSATADSIADFEDSEWTPPDSSYGAACPVCGFIPKRVRQIIEMTLITAMVFGLIYLIVWTSMIIAEANKEDGVDGSTANGNGADNFINGGSYNRTGTSSSSTNVVTDDDVYVEKYNNNNDDDSGNVDDAVAGDDNYNDDSNDDQYAGDDDGNDGSNNSQNNNYYANYGNTNRYYNQNYNYYNGNDNDDSNGRRRLRRRLEGKRINSVRAKR